MGRPRTLATDYDGTLAEHGLLEDATAAALERLQAVGWKLLLITGRQLGDLRSVCPRLPLFDAVVPRMARCCTCRLPTAAGRSPRPCRRPFWRRCNARGCSPCPWGW